MPGAPLAQLSAWLEPTPTALAFYKLDGRLLATIDALLAFAPWRIPNENGSRPTGRDARSGWCQTYLRPGGRFAQRHHRIAAPAWKDRVVTGQARGSGR